MVKLIAYMILLLCTMLGSTVWAKESSPKEPDPKKVLKVPTGGFGKLDKDEFIKYLSEAPVFQNALPDLEVILNDFHSNKVDFYELFTALRTDRNKGIKEQFSAKEHNLYILYHTLWLYQDRKQHAHLYEYLNSLTSAELPVAILDILIPFHADYFDESSYPYFEKVIISICDEKSPFLSAASFLNIFMEACAKIFSEKQVNSLADIGIKRVSALPLQKKEDYNNYFFVLSRYAGKESMPYFRAYFEEEYRSFNLMAVSEYFKKYMTKAEFASLLKRKADLLREAYDDINKELNLLQRAKDGGYLE